jgi:hypothetical protein
LYLFQDLFRCSHCWPLRLCETSVIHVRESSYVQCISWQGSHIECTVSELSHDVK